jgi:Holliday junction resolvase YEN1
MENVLKRFIARQSINQVVPGVYPKFDTLEKYNRPEKYSAAELRNHARANWNYDGPPLEVKLLRVACRRVNFWSKQYYDHIGPVLLSRFLAERDRSLSREIVHEIRLVKMKPKKTGDEQEPVIPVRKLTFSPTGVTLLKSREDFERLGSTRPWKTDTEFYGDR